MTVDELITTAGGIASLADKLGVDRCTIYDWKRAKLIPPARVFQIHDKLGLSVDALRTITREVSVV